MHRDNASAIGSKSSSNEENGAITRLPWRHDEIELKPKSIDWLKQLLNCLAPLVTKNIEIHHVKRKGRINNLE